MKGPERVVEELRERLRAVEDPVALLERIVAWSPLALQIFEPGGRSILTNKAFRDLFGSELSPEYNVLTDDSARATGVLSLIERSFGGETVHVPVTWYDPRALTQDAIKEGNRVAIERTVFPLWARDGRVGHVAVVFKDVTAQEVARAEVEAERDRLRLVLEQSGEAIIVADEQGALRIFNSEAVRQHGVGLQTITPREWNTAFDLLHEDGSRLPLAEVPLFRAFNGERVEGARWKVRRPDGSVRALAGSAMPLRHPDGSPAGAVLVSRDETERLAQERERAALLQRAEAARSEAEQADRAKDEFLAMLGHELRNPLAPVVTALALLRKRGVERGRELEVIDRQVMHLARLVDDLLDVSRITRGKIELRKAPFDVTRSIDRALEMVGPLIDERRHVLARSLPAAPLYVLGDETRLAQVLANLLTNAARYTEPGGRIEIAARREGDRTIVEVRDDGAGIGAELLPAIFGAFVQGRGSLQPASRGLGLTLAKSLVEAHGGTLRADSEGEGRGSTFTVSLPASDGATDAPTPAAEAAPPPQRRKRVLVVDDNRDAAELLAEALRLQGHEVAVAHEGEAALSLAATFAPDVGILDIGLPGMDGHELAARLLKQLGQHLELIAVTGYGQEHDRVRSAQAGFAAHLTKPVNLEVLYELVADAGARAQSTAGPAASRSR